MSTLVKVEAVMVGASVAGLVILVVVVRSLHLRGALRDQVATQRYMLPYLMVLFLSFGLALIGLGLHAFIVMQVGIGNGDRAPIAFLRRAQTGVTLGIWAFLLLGAGLGFPFMWRDLVGSRPSVGPSKGVLRADIGMTLDEARAGSTLSLAPTRLVGLDDSSQTIGDVVFDLQIAGGAPRFEQCRYYFISTGPKNDPKIDSINIGVSPYKKPRAQIDADEADIRRRLIANGWSPGRFVWRTEKDLALNGGEPTTGDGRYWAKGQTLLILSSRRMDDPKPGEDARTSGEFILFIDLVPRGSSTYANLEYGPAARDPGAPSPAGDHR